MLQVQQPPLAVHVRWLIRRDMPDVMRIEEGLRAPVEEADIVRWLRERTVIGMTAELGAPPRTEWLDDARRGDGPVAGYMVYKLFDHRLSVVRLAVGRAWRRRGVGRRLVEKLIAKLSSHRRRELEADVPQGEAGAALLFLAAGLRVEKALPGGGLRLVCRVPEAPEDEGAEADLAEWAEVG
jgi:ribosomal-protein-alanine N-acetyltransferase